MQHTKRADTQQLAVARALPGFRMAASRPSHAPSKPHAPAAAPHHLPHASCATLPGGAKSALLPALKSLGPTLERLDLSFTTGIKGDRDWDALGVALASLPRLEALALPATKARPCAIARLRGAPRLARLDLARNDLSGVLPALATLQQLTALKICFCKMPANGAAHLATLTGLTCLEWARSGVTDAIVNGVLSRMTGMRELSIPDARLSDAGMEALVRALPEVRLLDISSTPLSATGVAAQSRLQKLDRLYMVMCGVRGADVADALQGLTSLTGLFVSNQALGNVGATELARLRGLRELGAVACGITGAGARALTALTCLTKLGLLVETNMGGNNCVSSAACKELRDALPGVELY